MRWKTTKITKTETFHKFSKYTKFIASVVAKFFLFLPLFSILVHPCCIFVAQFIIIVKLLHISTLLTLGFWRNKDIEIIISFDILYWNPFLFRFNSWWIWKIITHKKRKKNEDEKFFFFSFSHFFIFLFRPFSYFVGLCRMCDKYHIWPHRQLR